MSEKADKIRVNVTLTRPYVDALDHLVEARARHGSGGITEEEKKDVPSANEIFKPRPAKRVLGAEPFLCFHSEGQ